MFGTLSVTRRVAPWRAVHPPQADAAARPALPQRKRIMTDPASAHSRCPSAEPAAAAPSPHRLDEPREAVAPHDGATGASAVPVSAQPQEQTARLAPRAEASPAEQQARDTLTQTLEQAVDAVVVIDEHNRVTLFNSAAEALWGHRRDDVLGRNVSMLVPLEFRSQHDGWVHANRQGGPNRIVGTSRTVQIERVDGSVRSGSMSISKIHTASGILYTAFVRDVTHEVTRREERRLLSLAVNETDSAIVVVRPDGRTIYINDGFTRMLGYQLSDMLGKIPSSVVKGPYTDPNTLAYIHERLRNGESFSTEILIYDRSGKPLWISAVVNVVKDEDGACTNMVGVWTDITHTKMHEVLQNQVLHAMAREAPILDVMRIICLQVESIAPGVVASIRGLERRGRLRSLAAPGLPRHYTEALDEPLLGAALSEHAAPGAEGTLVIFADQPADSWWAKQRERTDACGFAACWWHAIRSSDGRLLGTLTFYFREARMPDTLHRRIAEVCLNLCALALEREASKENIRRLAFYDSLTGLPNRSFLISQAESLLAEAIRSLGTLAVLFIDLDRFKHVNDSLGHPAGDALLREVARRLGARLDAPDVVGRLSGDEFVIVLSRCDAVEAASLCEAIMADLHKPITVGVTTLMPTASVGIAAFPEHGDDFKTLLLHADTAMYHAKALGRHRYAVFSAGLVDAAGDRLKLEMALRDALKHAQLQLHYQPQLKLDDGSLHGVEALARWHHPELGAVPPDTFIPLAEECGFITELDRWILRNACQQLSGWRRQGMVIPHVSVNMSPTSFRDRRLPHLIDETLRECGLSPADLMLEVTEGVMLDDATGGFETLVQVHELGIGLSIDDFGTGFSSLSYLHRLPVDELKLDKSFVGGLESDEGARTLAGAVVGIGASLRLKIVAEGVETDGQRAILRELGCQFAQGYLFGRPMAVPELAAWMHNRPAREN